MSLLMNLKAMMTYFTKLDLSLSCVWCLRQSWLIRACDLPASASCTLNFTGYILVPDNIAHGDVVICLLSLCCGKLFQSLTCILFILHFWDRVLCSPCYLGSLYVVEEDPEFLIFQPPPPKFWDIRHRLPCQFSLVQGMGTKCWLCWTSIPLAELHPKPYTFPLSLLLWRSETTLWY